MKLIQIKNNFHKLEQNPIAVYFSYETPIALYDGLQLFVSENVWSQTTGRHINYLIREKDATKIPHEDFLDILSLN